MRQRSLSAYALTGGVLALFLAVGGVSLLAINGQSSHQSTGDIVREEVAPSIKNEQPVADSKKESADMAICEDPYAQATNPRVKGGVRNEGSVATALGVGPSIVPGIAPQLQHNTVAPKQDQSKPVPPQKEKEASPEDTPQTGPAEMKYLVRYVGESGEILSEIEKTGLFGFEVVERAADLFDRGYELLDEAEKHIVLGKGPGVITFQYGKSREQMPIEEFLSREVNYDYPLVYRNLDFRGNQKALEDFVIKKIYQGDRTTGVFYGTEDQGEQVRRTMINGSLQGGYTRYAIDIVPLTPKHIEGDKYAIEIELRYFEDLDYIKEGEKKVAEFYAAYANRNLSDIEKAKLAHDWVLANIKLFVPPSNKPEWFYNTKGLRRVHFPASAMLDGEGVCLTYAMTYARLAERLGLDVRVVQGYYGTQKPYYDRAKEMLANPDTTTYSADKFNHSWNLVKVDGQWYHVDPFHEINMIGTLPDSPYHYFLRSDDFMSHSQITVKHPRYPARKMDIYKAWNMNRIHAAPESRNEEAAALPNLL